MPGLSLQAIGLFALWAAFLSLQLEKAKHNHCTWQFAVVAGSQALLLGAVTIAFTRYQACLACVPELAVSLIALDLPTKNSELKGQQAPVRSSWHGHVVHVVNIAAMKQRRQLGR